MRAKIASAVRSGAGVLAFAAAMLIAMVAGPAPARAQQQSQSAPAASGSMNGGMPNSGQVNLPQLPTITMTAVPSYGPGPLTVGFFANGVDPEGQGFVSYLWTFGDGQVSTAPPMMFFHTYTKPGTYIATVTATTADGRTATSYVGITVRPATD